MKLSIAVAAYNVENHIERTLHSLMSQTEKQFELIIVNDGSTDKTEQRVRDALNNELEIDYKIITKQNGGVSSARNRGLLEASGEYVMFLDGDDYVAEDLVKSIYGAVSSSKNNNSSYGRTGGVNLEQDIDVLCWGYHTVNVDGSTAIDYFKQYKFIKDVMTGDEALKNMIVSRTMWLWTGSAVFRKDFLTQKQLYYTEGCANGEDQEFSIKVLSRAHTVVFINKVLSHYVQRPESISGSSNVRKFDAIAAMNRSIAYLRMTGDEELLRIAEALKERHLVENYFNNLDSCMKHWNIRPLLKEIDRNYPGLDRDIRKEIKMYQGNQSGFDRFRTKCKLYLISPELYAAAVYLKRKMKGQGKEA